MFLYHLTYIQEKNYVAHTPVLRNQLAIVEAPCN